MNKAPAHPPTRTAKLALFRDAVDSACGMAQSATGPFYCPEDEKVYIELSFYDGLKRRFGAPGDFAQAYVLAHEIGHHVQRLLGIESQVQRAMGTHPGERNQLSVRLELQADCLAGVWGHSTAQRNILEAGDVEEALRAASAFDCASSSRPACRLSWASASSSIAAIRCASLGSSRTV